MARKSVQIAFTVSPVAATDHAIWTDFRDTSFEIYHKRSTDGGTSWGADSRLTSDTAYSGWPCIAASGTGVHAFWWDGRDGNPEIYYKRSTDAGATWEADTRLTNDTATSASIPFVALSGAVPFTRMPSDVIEADSTSRPGASPM